MIKTLEKKETDYNRNDFWEIFTGKPTNEFLNKEVEIDSSPLSGIQKGDFFINEVGIFFRVRNVFNIIGRNFAVRFHKAQVFNIHPEVCVYLSHRFLGDKLYVVLSGLSSFTEETEIAVKDINASEKAVIDEVIKKGRSNFPKKNFKGEFTSHSLLLYSDFRDLCSNSLHKKPKQATTKNIVQ